MIYAVANFLRIPSLVGISQIKRAQPIILSYSISNNIRYLKLLQSKGNKPGTVKKQFPSYPSTFLSYKILQWYYSHPYATHLQVQAPIINLYQSISTAAILQGTGTKGSRHQQQYSSDNSSRRRSIVAVEASSKKRVTQSSNIFQSRCKRPKTQP